MDLGDTINLNTSNVISVSSQLPGLLTDATRWQVLPFVCTMVITAGVLAIVTITVYSRLGFSDSTNISWMALGHRVNNHNNCALSVLLPNLPGANFTTSGHPHLLLSRVSALITTYLSLERYLCVLMPLRIKAVLTPKRTLIVMVIFFGAAFCVHPINIVAYPIVWKFYPEKNRTLLGVRRTTDTTVRLLCNSYLVVVSTILPFLTSCSPSSSL